MAIVCNGFNSFFFIQKKVIDIIVVYYNLSAAQVLPLYLGEQAH